MYYFLERVFVLNRLSIQEYSQYLMAFMFIVIVQSLTHVRRPDIETQLLCLPFGCLNISFKIGRRPVADI